MAEKDADRAHMQADAAETRDAAQRLRFKSELDAARMMINSRFIEHRKRSAAAIHQQKETRSKKQREMSSKLMTELEMANNKHKGEVTKFKQKQDARVVELRERLTEEKQVTDKVRQMGEEAVMGKKMKFQGALKTERKFHHQKATKVKQRRKHQHKTNIDNMHVLRKAVTKAKKESKELREALTRAWIAQREVKDERDHLLSHVTQLEFDFALKSQELDSALESASKPDFIFGMEKVGIRARRLSLRIVQLILELLVAGTPPASINRSILAFVGNMASHIKVHVKVLPSIWFIRRCWTVLLIVSQLIVAHRLSKSDKWGAMHSDKTGRRQVDILNLIITAMEDGDPSYVPILFSASILPENGTADNLHNSIINFIEEKKEWLVKWQEVIERDYPDYEHSLDQAGLDITKLQDGGHVVTDGCNTARKFNRMMVDTIKNAKKGQSVGMVISHSIAEAAASNRTEKNDVHVDCEG